MLLPQAELQWAVISPVAYRQPGVPQFQMEKFSKQRSWRFSFMTIIDLLFSEYLQFTPIHTLPISQWHQIVKDTEGRRDLPRGLTRPRSRGKTHIHRITLS